MCEMFAMSSRFPATVDFCLREFARHGGQTGPHRDGWGISYYAEDGAVQLYREAEPASGSDWVRFIQKHHPSSTIVLSHIRHATQGDVSLKNTQPFWRELGGRCHVFSHNGDLENIIDNPDFRLGFHRPIGETDSEYAFCNLLGRLEGLWLMTSGVPPLDRRFTIIGRFARDLRRLGMANFIYSDGDTVFAHGSRRRHRAGETPRAPGLHVLQRACSMKPEGTTGMKCHPTGAGSEKQQMLLIASVPLTKESWRPMEEGEVLAFGGGRILARASPRNRSVESVPYRS